MDIHAATSAYETWLGGSAPLDPADLAHKHARMADPADPFPFVRGTYYRWAQRWPEVCPDLLTAPRVLAVGDLHVENYGTWRDTDGRLCWGVNDFDEADELPYPHDLVRLAASVRVARRGGHLVVKFGAACDAILTGYAEAMAAGGVPFVLEERHPGLRTLALAAEGDPVKFWAKFTKLLADPAPAVPAGARAELERALPAPGLTYQVRWRRAGMGSLGRPRFVALAEWAGGWVAREAKAAAPPATAWATRAATPSRMADAVGRAVRSHDPFYRPGPNWVCRRLAPRCSRIELGPATAAADLDRLLHAMGTEAANVHLGTPGAAAAVRTDLARRPAGWLKAAAKAMTDAVEQDWAAWQGAAG